MFNEAIAVVSKHIGLLGERDFTTLKRRTRLGEPELAEIAALIRSLNPRPGAALASGPAEYVIPDVVVPAPGKEGRKNSGILSNILRSISRSNSTSMMRAQGVRFTEDGAVFPREMDEEP